MNKKILLYLALMVLGLYAMPNTVALFAGQHSFYGSAGIACDTCHSDVLSQLQSGAIVYGKHRAAAANYNYTTYLALGGKAYNGTAITAYNDVTWDWNPSAMAWKNSITSELKNVSLDTSVNSGVCMLCHNATLTGSTAHTGIIVRMCDDDRCHGNKYNFNNSPQLFNSNKPNITAAGYYLSRGNVHDVFYLDASNQSSGYASGLTFGQIPGNANGSSGFISRGHWTCEGCHTETVANVTIIQAPVYNHSDPNATKKRY